MKFIITENKREKVALNWLNKNYGDLEPVNSSKYPDNIFFVKDDEVVFDYKKSTNIALPMHRLWSFLENVLGFNYEEIQKITTEWIRNRYHLNVKRTQYYGDIIITRWKDYNV